MCLYTYGVVYIVFPPCIYIADIDRTTLCGKYIVSVEQLGVLGSANVKAR